MGKAEAPNSDLLKSIASIPIENISPEEMNSHQLQCVEVIRASIAEILKTPSINPRWPENLVIDGIPQKYGLSIAQIAQGGQFFMFPNWADAFTSSATMSDDSLLVSRHRRGAVIKGEGKIKAVEIEILSGGVFILQGLPIKKMNHFPGDRKRLLEEAVNNCELSIGFKPGAPYKSAYETFSGTLTPQITS